MGGSSNIDATIPGDVDDANGWDHGSDGTLESRQYLLQTWRADVVAVVDSKANPIEYVRYSAYDVPYVYAAGDMNRDGVSDSADEDAWNDLWNSGTGTARVSLDVNRDGAVSDSDDLPLVQTQIAAGSWASSGRGVLSRVGVRKGYAGYEWDSVVSLDHVRHRVYLPEMGRWGRRDPAGYRDGESLQSYARSHPQLSVDPTGLVSYWCDEACMDMFHALGSICNLILLPCLQYELGSPRREQCELHLAPELTTCRSLAEEAFRTCLGLCRKIPFYVPYKEPAHIDDDVVPGAPVVPIPGDR